MQNWKKMNNRKKKIMSSRTFYIATHTSLFYYTYITVFATHTSLNCYTYIIELLHIHHWIATHTSYIASHTFFCTTHTFWLSLCELAVAFASRTSRRIRISNFSSHSHLDIIIMNLLSFLIIEVYFNLENLIVALNTHVDTQSYVVVKQRTKKNSKTNQMMKTYFRCDREDKSKNVEHDRKKKHFFTRLMNCFFFCFDVNKINLNWVIVIREATHNHSSIIESFHSMLRKMTMIIEMKSSIDAQLKAQFTASQILIIMRLKDENCILRAKDIYNAKQAIRLQNLDSLTSTQYLLRSLKRDNWYHRIQIIEISKEITHLFFVKRHIVDILKNNYEICIRFFWSFFSSC